MKFETSIREIIATTIANHPKDCVFRPDAVEGAVQWLKENSHLELDGSSSESIIDELIKAIQSQEIYCPHEGIDRRQEYYSKINLDAWSEWASIAHEMI